jgi:hypothetical protein
MALPATAQTRHLSITLEPTMTAVPDNTPIGTVLATITVKLSNGQPFTGSLGFGKPYHSDDGRCAIEGHTVILGAPFPPGYSTQLCTITARE